MHVRATTIHGDPARFEDGIAFVRDRIVPVVDSLPGSLGTSMLVDRDTGVASVTTAWTSAQARAASEDVLGAQRAEAAALFGGGPPTTELLELAVLDRRRDAAPGFWCRTTRVRIDPHRIDSAVDAYAASILPELALLDGYCSAALLVDRMTGFGSVSVTFDSRAALEASRGPAERLRVAGSAQAGAQVTDVRESELVLAGIREPSSAAAR